MEDVLLFKVLGCVEDVLDTVDQVIERQEAQKKERERREEAEDGERDDSLEGACHLNAPPDHPRRARTRPHAGPPDHTCIAPPSLLTLILTARPPPPPTTRTGELSLPQATAQREPMVVYETLSFSRLDIDITLRMGQVGDEDESISTLKKLGINLLLTFFGNMNHLPIRIASINFSRHLSSPERFGERIAMQYILRAIPAVLTLLLSLDIVGGVWEILVGLYEGLSELFVSPFYTWLSSTEWGAKQLGVKQITRSQARLAYATALILFPWRLAYLCFLFMSNIVSVVSRALSLLTIDQDYVSKHAQQVRRLRQGRSRGPCTVRSAAAGIAWLTAVWTGHCHPHPHPPTLNGFAGGPGRDEQAQDNRVPLLSASPLPSPAAARSDLRLQADQVAERRPQSRPGRTPPRHLRGHDWRLQQAHHWLP